MAAKQTYSVRLDDEQRRQLEDRSELIGLPVGHLIRSAISDFLRQQEEKDYLAGVEARFATLINRLARQVEKDRAEQQLVVGMLDGVREWLAFTLPPPADKVEAQALMKARNEQFMKLLPLRFVSQSRAKITELMDKQDAASEHCPVCSTGRLKCKEGKYGLFWYCTNWNAEPKCDARYEDAGGHPQLTEGSDA